jgi:hypothetical protein
MIVRLPFSSLCATLIVCVQDDQDKHRTWIRLTREEKAREDNLVPLVFVNREIAQQGIPEED